MNQSTMYKIESNAKRIHQFLKLSPEQQEELLPILDEPFRLAVEVVETIADCDRTEEEIANLLSRNKTTVKHCLTALSSGGFPVIQLNSGEWSR